MTFGESVTGACFKISFKCDSFFVGFKSKVGFSFSWFEFGCMRYFACVVFCKTDFKSPVLPIYCWSGCKRLRKIFSPGMSRKPSVALRAVEGILRTLRFTSLVFASKKIYGQQDGLAIRSFSEGWWSRWERPMFLFVAQICCNLPFLR